MGSFLITELNYDTPTVGLGLTTFLVRDPFGLIPFVGDLAAEFPSFIGVFSPFSDGTECFLEKELSGIVLKGDSLFTGSRESS